VNPLCPAQKTRRLEYFAKRDALDLEGLGGIVADQLVARGLVSEPLDVFDLKLPELAALNLGTDEAPRVFGEKNARRLLEAVERSRSMPLERWLLALAIPEVGETTARDIAQYHDNLEAVAESELLRDVVRMEETQALPVGAGAGGDLFGQGITREERDRRLEEIQSRLVEAGFASWSRSKTAKNKVVLKVGPVTARSVLAYFDSPRGRAVRERLAGLGIDPRGPGRAGAVPSGPLGGKSFVITGTLSRPRPEFEARIRALGGRVAGSVSARTDYLLAGDEAGSKLDKARALGVAVLNEGEFERLAAG
jgi:DNA ligase (NAD+)